MPNSNILVHLICGSTGAGKSTYSRELAERIGAMRFSLDEWMSQLFWMDRPEPLYPEWALERVRRCEEQIWSTVLGATALGVPCVLDWGFSRAEKRTCYFSRAAAAGLSAQLHFVDLSAAERWRRVQSRNDQMRATNPLPFSVTREMFDFVEGLWEPPSQEEMRLYRGITVDSSGTVSHRHEA